MLKLFNSSRTRISLACRCISTSSVRCQQKEMVKTQEWDQGVRVIEKKPTRLPLVKNFFLKIVDTELMGFPEAIFENEHLNKVQQKKKSYEDFLEANIFEDPDDVNNVAKLKEFGSFKLNSTLTTDYIYSAGESEAKFLSYATFLNSHHQVLKLINEFGSESLKLNFASKLDSGELIGTSALHESKYSDQRLMVTEAAFKDDTNSWVLNGEKSCILLSPARIDTTLFLVIASSESVDLVGDFKEGLVALLVEGSLPGVKITKVDELSGCAEKPFNQVTVSFENVTVDSSRCLSEDGMKVATNLMNLSRLDTGVRALSGVMKPLVRELIDHSINTKIQNIQMKDVHTIKEQIGSLACSCYALESMIYMTAGLMDIYEKQDVEEELAMVHAFALQSMTDFMVRPLHAVGPRAVVKSSPFERFIRDATHLAAASEHLDAARQFVGLKGLNHAGVYLVEDVKKNRNPLHHPAFIFSKMFNQVSIKNPKKTLNLEHFLHPSLQQAADFLECSILRLNAATEILLARHGSLVVENTVEVAKLADAAILCYAMFASASRASRSYCIGLRNADQEINIAQFVCFDGMKKVKQIALDIDNGQYSSGEYTHKALGEKLIEAKDYNYEHPTARNF